MLRQLHQGKGASLGQASGDHLPVAEIQGLIPTAAVGNQPLGLPHPKLPGWSFPVRLGWVPGRPRYGLSTRKASAGEELPWQRTVGHQAKSGVRIFGVA